MHNDSIGSRTFTGAKAHHSRLPMATTVHLNRARQKDVVAAAAKVNEAPTEMEEEGTNGPK
jgi:hypothetical protein